MTPWQTYEIPVGACLCGGVDSLTLWLWHVAGEWRLASRQERVASRKVAVTLDCEPPADLVWTRFAAADDMTRVRLLPALPALPVVLRPADALNLLPAHRAAFFVGVPISIRVEMATPHGHIRLAEIPVQTLSKTWSGAPDDEDGMLSLALRSRARRTLPELGGGECGRAICALNIHNHTAEVFEFQRLVLLTDHLGVFGGRDGQLWTTPMDVSFHGHGSAARMAYHSAAPSFASDATVLTPPRITLSESLSRRVLSAWRSPV